MKKKILVSTLIILVVVAASLGATMAWFTAVDEVPENVFQAGTVILNAEDSWHGQSPARSVYNWNPGDCTDKMIAVTYEGSKRAFLRMQITETWANVWLNADNKELGYAQPNPAVYYDRILPNQNIEWKVYIGSAPYESINWATYNPKDPANAGDWKAWNADGKWKYYDPDLTDTEGGWWYYNGDDQLSTQVGPHTIKAISGVTTPGTETTIMIVGLVCLDGPKTNNNFQGAKYTISATFQAIQASHQGGTDGWSWENVNFTTGLNKP